jgi:hypothetical protein
MKRLGVHQIKIDQHRSSYFIERPFGNYLVFSDHLQTIDEDFFISRGGIYKQFIQSSSNIGEVQGKLFNRFGAYGVGDALEYQVNAYLPMQRVVKDFNDPAFRFESHGEAKKFLIDQRGKKILILGNEFYLNEVQKVILRDKDWTKQLVEQVQSREIDFVFFSHYDRSPHWAPKGRPWWKKFFRVLD